MLNKGVWNDVVETFAELPPPGRRRPGSLGTVGNQQYVVKIVAGFLTWVAVGGGASIVTQVVVGSGAAVAGDDVDVVEVNPMGGAVVLTVPTLANRTPGRALRIVQIGPGTVSLVSASPLFVGTSAYTMAARNDVVTLTPQTGGWRLASFVGAPQTFTAWIDAATGSDANVGTAAAPLATLAEAIARAAKVRWLTTMDLNVRGPALLFPNVTIPGGIGSMAQPARIVGLQTVVATGVFSATTPSTVRTPLFASVAGAPWTAGQFRGDVLRITSGAASGTAVGIPANSTNTLTTLLYSGAMPAPGDSFEILRNVTTLTGFSQINGGTGYQLALTNVTVGAFVLAQSCFFLFSCAMFTGGAFFEQNVDILTSVGAYGVMFVTNTPTVVNVGSMNATRLALHNVSMQTFRDAVTIIQAYGDGTARFNVRAMTSISSLYCPDSTLAAGTHFVESSNGDVMLTNASINNVTGDSAIGVINGTMRLEGVRGSGNAGVPVTTDAGSSIQVVDPDTGTTITGAVLGADVRVGGNPPCSWADIATNLTGFTTDIGAPQSQLCRVGR